MSTLSSLSFGQCSGVDEIPVEVLQLFEGLVLDPYKNNNIDYASEIVMNGLNGKIDLTGKFNMTGYINAIKKNRKLHKHNTGKKIFGIASYTDDKDEKGFEYGTIREEDMHRSMAEKMKDAVEELIDDESLMYAVSEIKSINDDLICEEQVNLVQALLQAKSGYPEAVKVVKSICDKYKVIGELVHEVLNSGKDLNKLFAN